MLVHLRVSLHRIDNPHAFVHSHNESVFGVGWPMGRNVETEEGEWVMAFMFCKCYMVQFRVVTFHANNAKT